MGRFAGGFWGRVLCYACRDVVLLVGRRDPGVTFRLCLTAGRSMCSLLVPQTKIPVKFLAVLVVILERKREKKMVNCWGSGQLSALRASFYGESRELMPTEEAREPLQ